MQLRSNFKLFAAVHFDSTKYVPSPSMGVNRFMLDRVGSEKARATTIVEYKPNSKFPEHTHIGGEEFLVLEGTFKDQFGEFPAGTYVRNPIDSKHAPWVDEDGCTILVKLLQMADTGEGTDPLHVPYDHAKESFGTNKTDYGSVLELYKNDKTGECVQMCWLDPNAQLANDEDDVGGEELFVVNGSLVVGGEDYEKWGWIRFPSGNRHEKRASLQAGGKGAQVYRKMGHLTEKALAMEKIQIKDES